MSLIEEALRRVQQEAAGSSEPRPAPAPRAAVKTDQPVSVHSWPTTEVLAAPSSARTKVKGPLAVVALGAVLGIGISFWLERGGRDETVRLQQVGGGSSALSAPSRPLRAPRAGIRAHPRDANALVLSGIAAGPGQPYAVINGQVVGVGEFIGDSTLLEVTESAVRLRRPDGTEIILRLPPS